MSQQLSAGRSLHGQKCFSSVSAVSRPKCCRTIIFLPIAPFGRTCGVWRHNSQSLWNEDGCQQTSFGRRGWGYQDVPYNSGTHGSVGGALDRSCGREGLWQVPINKGLLQPLCVRIDPEIRRIRQQEREQMKSLNEQFACFINKVQRLEQRNRELVTKWDLLQKQVMPPQKNLKQVFEGFTCRLQRQLDLLLQERGQMKLEQSDTEKLVEELKCKCEQEVTRHTAAKKQLMLLKKDVDCVYLTEAELDIKLEILKRETELLKCVFAQEIAELERSLCDASVVVKMDNGQGLAMEGILKSIKCWYEDVARKSRAELDALYRTRYQELEEAKERHHNELKSHQQEVEELSVVTQRWQRDLDNMKKQVSSLQTSISATENHRDCALKDAREKHVELQNALQKAKDELACMLRGYQELLDVKRTLDIEIATYKTLLEGEESRISTGIPVNMLVSAPCSIVSGPGCGVGPAGRWSRRQCSLCGAGRAPFPAENWAYQRGFTSRSTASSMGRRNVPGATGWSYISRSGEWRSRSGDYLCQGSASQGTGEHGGRTKEMGEKSRRAQKSSRSSAHPPGMSRPRMRISTGPCAKHSYKNESPRPLSVVKMSSTLVST